MLGIGATGQEIDIVVGPAGLARKGTLWSIAAEGNLPVAFNLDSPPEIPRLTTARNPVAAGLPIEAIESADTMLLPEDMLPAADKMPVTKSAAETKKALAADKKVAMQMVVEAGEKNLGGKKVAAPWDPTERLLGEQFLSMIGHLSTHKAQLYYYLKLQGKPVNTAHLYGMM